MVPAKYINTSVSKGWGIGEDHVGIYIGDGLTVDAPAPGQDVMVQAIAVDPYSGAVRIS